MFWSTDGGITNKNLTAASPMILSRRLKYFGEI
jgi:hypothetical protein